MKKFALIAICGLLLAAVFGLIPKVNAADNVQVIIEVTYFANYDDPGSTDIPDMSDQIFIGAQEEPVGRGRVVLALTENGEFLIDDVPFDPNPGDNEIVPGLHIIRNADGTGKFIQFNTHGDNQGDDIEDIKFSIEFVNAKITGFFDPLEQPYDIPLDGVCGIVEGDPQSSTTEDEYVINVGGATADFCSSLGGGNDRVRVYFEPQDLNAPEITNVQTSPELPINHIEGREKNLSIDFDSSEFPLEIEFRLVNDLGEVVDAQEHSVGSESDLPLTFTIKEEIARGDYRLFMFAEDLDGNTAEVFIGDINVIDERRRSGGSDDEPRHDEEITIFDEDLNLNAERLDTGIGTADNSPIMLNDNSNSDYGKESSLGFGGWLAGFIALDLILLLFVLIFASVRKR